MIGKVAVLIALLLASLTTNGSKFANKCGVCRPCSAARSARWSAANREYVNQKQRAWNAKRKSRRLAEVQ